MALLSDSNQETQRGKKRVRTRQSYSVNGKLVCKSAFLILMDISNYTLKTLKKHKRSNGTSARVHGNTGRRPQHSTLYQDVLRVVSFIRNFSDEYGLPQPAAMRGDNALPVVFLPSSTTKIEMHHNYKSACAEQNVRSLQLTSFKTIWSECVLHIRIATPRDDVCATCERLRRQVGSVVEEDDTLQATEALRDHVLLARRVHLFRIVYFVQSII